jgi:Tol biopolymer transport system component
MNWRVPTLAVVLLAGVLTAFFMPALSEATPPGKNGRIAYQVKDRSGRWQIWVANSDLSGARELTHGREDGGWPAWSPDGKQIAFDSERSDHTPKDSRHVNDVFVMKADGSGVKKLTDSKGESGDPAWSPTGRTLAIDADRGNRKELRAIYVIHANGGKPRRITKPAPPLSDYSPRFSPDGTQLVFLRARGTAESAPAALFTVRLDGSHLHQLTQYSLHVDQSDYSPDGKRIVFEAYPHGRGNGAYGDIFVIDARGGKPLNLTRNPVGEAGSLDPVWSPDGQKLLFLDIRRVNGVGRYGLATINPDGSDRQFVSSKNLEEHEADWESVGAAGARQLASAHSKGRNGPLTLFLPATNGPTGPVARIVAFASGKQTTIWHCPHYLWCGQSVSFAWAPDGRRVALTLDEIGGTSTYVGLHVLNVVSKRDTHVPGGAPRTASTADNPAAWSAYLKKIEDRIGCWPAANLAWSPDGTSIAYNCGPRVNVLELHGSGFATVPTGTDAFWPTWSPTGTRIAYSTRLKPSKKSEIYTVALDGSHRRLVATGGAAPAWSPDGRTIAYQTRCGIRLVTPSGSDVTPRATANGCSAIGRSGPPVWSPDGQKLAVEANPPQTVMARAGIWVFAKNGGRLHLVSHQAATTWYGALPGRPSWRAMH